MNPRRLLCLTPLLLAATAPLAQAHPGHGPVDFTAGFLHPLTGWDHLLAMLSVGLWAAQIGGRAKWALPCAFVGAMMVGAAIGIVGISSYAAEWGILASVFMLGLLLAAAVRPPLWSGLIGVGLAGCCHGMAHGAEMPLGSNSLEFLGGMIATTALLHIIGVAVGSIPAIRQGRMLRLAGAAMIATGFFLV